MQFLKTLFWVAFAVILVLFASINWNAVTIKLWGGLEADAKLPILILAAFLLGFLPMLVVHRARLWPLKRLLALHERPGVLVQSAPHVAPPPAPVERNAPERTVWPTSCPTRSTPAYTQPLLNRSNTTPPREPTNYAPPHPH